MNYDDKRKLEAVVFDMDGVLIDSENHWLSVGNELVKKWVTNWAVQDHHKIMGLSGIPLYDMLCKNYRLKAKVEDFLLEYNESIKQIYSTLASPLEGVLQLITAIKEIKKVALATSADRKYVNIILERFDLWNYFDGVLSISDIGCAGKPEPDVYLQTAKKLGIDPKNCMAIEDSEPGVQSAIRAEMKVIGFRNGFNDKQDLSQASSELRGFANVTTEDLFSHY